MKRITIRDIARQAGVVPSTVSFVLNGKAKQMRISDKVAERIRKLAEDTGYTPHHTAVSLRTGKSHILGLIVEDISNVFFAALARTIEEEAYASGYKIVYCSSENDDDRGRELIRMLANQQVDGYLITPTPGMEKDVEKLTSAGKPVVLVDRYFSGTAFPCILVDNYDGVKKGMEHLIEKGYRNIGFITIDLDQVQMKERLRGYRDALKDHGLTYGDKLLLTLNYNRKEAAAVKTITSYIKKHPQLDALFFATNYLGIYGLESLKALKRRIPEDIAMICFDDHDIFRLYTPSITIIQQPIAEIGRNAVQMLLKQMEKQPSALKELQQFKKARLIEREST